MNEAVPLAGEPLGLLLLVLGGLVAGTINVLAGGGTLLTLPLLIVLGVPPTVANGTNRVAILAQNVVATSRFHGSGHLPRGIILRLLPTTLVGALAGAFVASRLDDDTFRPILGVLLAVMAGSLLLDPSRWLKEGPDGEPDVPVWIYLAFLGVGFHGGFIQAGLGFLALAALVPGLGLDLVRANAVKVTLVLCLTIPALAIFAMEGRVDWLAGAALALGNAGGGLLGHRLAVTRGPGWIRWILVVMVVVSAGFILFGH